MSFWGAGADSNYALMMSTLKYAACPEPHGYANFVIKTMTFIGMQMRATLGKVPIYCSVGINDAICGNYTIELDAQRAVHGDGAAMGQAGQAAVASGRLQKA